MRRFRTTIKTPEITPPQPTPDEDEPTNVETKEETVETKTVEKESTETTIEEMAIQESNEKGVEEGNICPYCGRTFKSPQGLKTHLRYCKKKPH